MDDKTTYSPLVCLISKTISGVNRLIEKLEKSKREKNKIRYEKEKEEEVLKLNNFKYSDDEQERFFQEVLGEGGENVVKKIFTNQVK